MIRRNIFQRLNPLAFGGFLSMSTVAYCAMSQRQFRLPSALSGKEIRHEIA